jgi:beta-ureidopropionase / N-carbamoyl-L-amino-acid hydrolase
MDPQINSARLWQSLMDLAKIGATPKGGVCRLALSDLDKQGRDLVTGWCKDAGLTLTVDKVGNIFARRAGRDNNLAPVVAGSHIDTQPSGGKFDGNYGVMAALEVVRTLNDKKIETKAPVEVAIWTNEEGSRFQPVMMGSGVFAKIFPLEHALKATDTQGQSVREELKRIGYAGEAPVGERELGAYFETHIEQGPILEEQRKTIGVVQGSLGSRWYDVTFLGQDNHAGTTPMNYRKDALLGAAGLVAEVYRIGAATPHGRGTVGFMQVKPNSRNVVPGEVKMSVDFRHPDAATLDQMDHDLKRACEEICADLGLTHRINEVSYFQPTAFDSALVASVRDYAGKLGYSHMDIISGAGHDAVYVARVNPTAMIFVPCEGGISHNETESATPEDLAAGCNVLLHAMLARAG